MNFLYEDNVIPVTLNLATDNIIDLNGTDYVTT